MKVFSSLSFAISAGEAAKEHHTSLSSCFAKRVICLMIKRGVSSESFTINADTDFGPLVSLELNSLFASSLCQVSLLLITMSSFGAKVL